MFREIEENTLVNIEDLIVGDEVLIGGGGNFRYYRILSTPGISKKNPTNYKGNPNYKSLKCSTVKHRVAHTYIQPVSQKVRTYYTTKYFCTSENHNHILWVNFNDKYIWLVKANRNN